MLLKKEIPSEHFMIKRSLPGKAFDYRTYQHEVNEVQTQLQSQSRQGFTAQASQGSWSSEGPGNIGGRFTSLAAHPLDTNVIFGGSAYGGIYRTLNGGNSWSAVFDAQASMAIACVEIDRQHPDTIWAGTGDPDIPGSAFVGDGIYKSTDGGNTWQHSGLRNQHVISQIRVMPGSSNVIFAACMGLPMKRNTDRGLYRSIDFGQNWTKVLYLSDDTGCDDIVIDPANPRNVYVSTRTRIRNNQESLNYGPLVKIYKSTNGGSSFTALPSPNQTATFCRIGLNILPNGHLYACAIDSDYVLDDVYKSTNGGQSWQSLQANSSLSSAMGGFGWYFGKMLVNPIDQNEVFVCAIDLFKTSDGGNNWNMAGPPWWSYDLHADKHDIVYDAAGNLILATDGGIYKSYDKGDSWKDIEDIENTQFYRITINPHRAGEYSGGAQDNGTMTGNAMTSNSWSRDWGGDGFQPLYHPTDPLISYAETQYGRIYYSDDGKQNYSIFDAGMNSSDRVNWDAPYMFNHFNPGTMYRGTDRVYKVTQAPFGTWQAISNDLTDGNIFGRNFHNISAIEQDHIDPLLLYAGTSDGNFWYSDNGGILWRKAGTGLFPKRYISSLRSSPNTRDLLYMALQGYHYHDSAAHIFRSFDQGKSWSSVSGNLPPVGINDILCVPGDDSTLFVANDVGVYYTRNSGHTWERVGSNMPAIPVNDIEVDGVNRKLIAGTFGRSMQSFPIDSLFLNTSTIRAEKQVIRIYPNPTSRFVSMDLGSFGQARVKIYSLDGKLLKTLQVQHGSPIDILKMPNGVLIFMVELEDRGKIIKVLKL